MSDVYGRRLQVLSFQPREEQRLPLPEAELHGHVVFQTRIDREHGVLWVKEDLDDEQELGPYDANAFDVAFPVKGAA